MKENHKKLFYAIPVTVSFFSPLLLLAFSLADSTFRSTILEVISVISTLITVLAASAFVTFFWGLSKFILNSNKPEEIKKGQQYMMWGILAIFVLLTFEVIVGLISKEFEIGSDTLYVSDILLPTK